ncbi:MAG: fibronectin type III domain-containing protein, partial [Treponema sp.]|nr:fibronectin type III domain-containing protein [Treponema sp.]
MKRFVSRFEGGAVLKRALPVAAALCLAAGAALFSGCDLGTGGGLPPSAPVIQSVSIKSSNTQTNTTNQGGTITVTWDAVTGAAGYEVYYAANVDAAPSIPAAPAKTVTVPATTATITATGIGNDTMNYYVWVKAVNGNGTSGPSAPASTLDRFIGHWTDPMGYDDGMYIKKADFLYDAGSGYGVCGNIRAVVPFNNNQSVNGHSGPAGVIIIEYDATYMSGSSWTWAGTPNYFNAVYYYGLSGSGAGATAYLGVAAEASSEYRGEVADVDAAITKFTLAAIDSFIDATYAAKYTWQALPPPPDFDVGFLKGTWDGDDTGSYDNSSIIKITDSVFRLYTTDTDPT